MAVEWREVGRGLGWTALADVHVGEHVWRLQASDVGRKGDGTFGAWRHHVYLGEFPTRDAAKSAALAEARRLLREAMEEIGDG